MLRYFLTRLAGAVPTLFIIVTLAFFLIRAAPGGPFDQEQTLPPEIMANLQRAYGLDQPIWTQYGRYLAAILHGDFGPSFKYKDFSVTELIGQWQAEIAAGVRHMQAAGEIAPDLDPVRTAAAIVAGIQGGVVMLMSTGDTTPLESALDLAIAYLQATAPRVGG